MIIFLILGFVASIFQLTLFREFTFSVAKNELSFIVAAGCWLLSCSLASFGRRKKYIISNITLAVLLTLAFAVCVTLAHLIKAFAGFNYYESVGFVFSLLAAFLVMAPVGMLAGYAFAQFSENYLNKDSTEKKVFGLFFAYEAAGFFLGGILFTFIFSRYQNPFQFCCLPLLFIPLLKIDRREKLFAVMLIMSLSLAFFNAYANILKKEFQGAEIITYQGSPYGPLIVSEKDHAQTLSLNGSLVATSEDKEADEMFIHSVFAASPTPGNVLWIGPLFTLQLQELKKYNARIICVDLNPRPSHLPMFYANASSIRYIVEDPKLFLSKNKDRYDLILMNIPPPSNLSFNRFYTIQFFEQIKARLTPNGILAFSLPSKRDILSPVIKNFNSCVLNTLSRTFTNRFLIPGDNMIVLASFIPLSAENILKNFDARSLKTRFFTRYHLKDALDTEKQDYIEGLLDKKAAVNTDLTPYAFVDYLFVEQAKFHPRLTLPLVPIKNGILAGSLFLIAIFFFLLPRKKETLIPADAAVCGFLAIGFSTIIYFMFQIISGTLFWKLGLLIGLFMIGLAAGSFGVNHLVEKSSTKQPWLKWLFVLWFIFAAEIFFWTMLGGRGIFFEIIWMTLSLEAGLLTGGGYPIFSNLSHKTPTDTPKVPALIYALDLAGASLGTIFFSVLFIPFLGIPWSLSILTAVIIITGIANLKK